MKSIRVFTIALTCSLAFAISGCSGKGSIAGVIVQKSLEKADDEVISKLKNNDVAKGVSRLIGIDLDKLGDLSSKIEIPSVGKDKNGSSDSKDDQDSKTEADSVQESEQSSEQSSEDEKTQEEHNWEVLYSYGEDAFVPETGLMDFGFCQIDIAPYWQDNAYVLVTPEGPAISFYTQKGRDAGYGQLCNIFIADEAVLPYVVNPYILGACDEGIIMAYGIQCAPYPQDDEVQKFIYDNMEKELPSLYNCVITPNVLPDDWDEQLLKQEHEAGNDYITIEDIRNIPVLPRVLPEGWDKPCNAVDPYNGRELFEPATFDNSPFFGTWLLAYNDYSTWTDASREANHCSGQVEPWFVFCRDGRLIWNAYGDYKEGTYKICSPGSEEEEAIGYIDGKTLNIGVYQGGMWVAGMPEIEKTEYSGEKVKTNVWTFEFRTSEELTEEQGF